MKRLFHIFCTTLLWLDLTLAQIKSGPMLGYIELRTAKIWCEVIPDTKINVEFWPETDPKQIRTAFPTTSSYLQFETILFQLVDLQPGTKYFYRLIESNPKKSKRTILESYSGSFITQELWQWRKPAPDFSILTGSCSYQNETSFDRPGKPYGTDSSIFLTMTKEDAKLMVWLGDNWYTREVDYYSEWGLWNRASRDRSAEVFRGLFKKMSHVAIWDDHDYGPNNEGLSFIFKEASRKVFQAYFANPSYGMNGQGIYTKVSYNDIDMFLLDDRTWRSSDDMDDFVNGKPNPIKKMYGPEQLNWLKNALLNSNAAFKIIVTGSQVLNTLSPTDCLSHFPIEKNELMEFLESSKVNGVLFLTGDRHMSEIIKQERDSLYPLYDITVSSLTAGISKARKEERDNPNRVKNTLLEEHNYGRLSFTGNKQDRKLKIEFIDKEGVSRSSFEITAASLKNKK